MRYLALATDYDNTIATEGHIPSAVVEGLRQLRASGRKLILVTGRELPDLLRICPEVDLFDRVVAENGALLYRPHDRTDRLLGEPFPPAFLQALRARGVPVSAGRSIIATVEPHETVVLECIRELGLELQVIFNREAVMVLPSGVNKATGLKRALEELQLSVHNVVAIGDGENDHAFIDASECAVAVANGVPSLREHADFVTSAPAGAGVLQVIEALLRDDFSAASARLTRHHLILGTARDGRPLRMPSYGQNILITGASGSGKSTFATGFLEQLGARGYQYCILDPEGDYDDFEGAITLGSAAQPPAMDDVLELLEEPHTNVAVNLLGVRVEDRPASFREFLIACAGLRARVGRPHWFVIDEAHHLLSESSSLPTECSQGIALVTVHAERLPRKVLEPISVVVAIGKSPADAVHGFARAVKVRAPKVPQPQEDEAVVWLRDQRDEVLAFSYERPVMERKRHQRKYAEGDLGVESSFYFRGPDGRLNLRAQNLQIFMQIADGVDDETWTYHLRKGDYSRWFAQFIKDDELVEATRAVEGNTALSPAESRRRLRSEIERRYTTPA